MQTVDERSTGFVGRLLGLAEPGREDRGALADLRSGLGRPPGEAARMYRYVVPYLGDRERDADRWFYVVGALFAWHPKQENGQSFAASFGKLWKQQRKLWKQQSRSDSVEARFFALLNSHPDDLPDHLRQAVGLLRAQEIGLDWFRLLRDLVRWSRPNRTVQNRWAREFYRGDRSQAVHADESDSDGEESEE